MSAGRPLRMLVVVGNLHGSRERVRRLFRYIFWSGFGRGRVKEQTSGMILGSGAEGWVNSVPFNKMGKAETGEIWGQSKSGVVFCTCYIKCFLYIHMEC